MISNLKMEDIEWIRNNFNDLLSLTISYVRKEQIIKELKELYKIKKKP